MEELEHVEILSERLQRRDRGIGKRRVARGNDAAQRLGRNVRRKYPHELEAEFGVGKLLKRRELAGEIRQRLRQE